MPANSELSFSGSLLTSLGFEHSFSLVYLPVCVLGHFMAVSGTLPGGQHHIFFILKTCVFSLAALNPLNF